jgi:hypothetical protein
MKLAIESLYYNAACGNNNNSILDSIGYKKEEINAKLGLLPKLC